jgi:hypothetical protein
MKAAKKPDDGDSLERAIAGALRATIRDHGPITPEWIGSAVKRILGNLRNARVDGLARELARRRWAGVSDDDRREHQAAAARSGWAGMTAEERSAEMSRRRRAGLKRRGKP